MTQENIDRMHDLTHGWSEDALGRLCEALEQLLECLSLSCALPQNSTD